MNLPNDSARCDGGNCPSKTNCKRYTDRGHQEYTMHAALWVRRDPGELACDMVMFNKPVTTFRE